MMTMASYNLQYDSLWSTFPLSSADVAVHMEKTLDDQNFPTIVQYNCNIVR